MTIPAAAIDDPLATMLPENIAEHQGNQHELKRSLAQRLSMNVTNGGPNIPRAVNVELDKETHVAPMTSVYWHAMDEMDSITWTK